MHSFDPLTFIKATFTLQTGQIFCIPGSHYETARLGDLQCNPFGLTITHYDCGIFSISWMISHVEKLSRIGRSSTVATSLVGVYNSGRMFSGCEIGKSERTYLDVHQPVRRPDQY